jgi:micrococcal nuclease
MKNLKLTLSILILLIIFLLSTNQSTQHLTNNTLTPTANSELNKPAQSSNPVVSSNLYKVVSVVDGDTIKIDLDGKKTTVRLLGIDTPETVDPRKPVQCFGKEASAKLKELIAGKNITTESDPSQGDKDKYGRLLRYIYLEDGTFINEMMIKEGFAFEYTYNLPYKYQAEFKKAQQQAQLEQKGLWAEETCNGIHK